jgi:hypothetical protein
MESTSKFCVRLLINTVTAVATAQAIFKLQKPTWEIKDKIAVHREVIDSC